MSLCHIEAREKVVNVKCMEHWGEMRRDSHEIGPNWTPLYMVSKVG